ncbi:predicted protein, partial [Nematostella vectensis]
MYEDFNPDDFIFAEEPTGRFGFMQTFRQCAVPTITQTLDNVGPLLVMCVILRLIAILRVPRWLVHLVSALTGIGAMTIFIKEYMGYPLVMCLVGYPVLFVFKGYRGPLMSLVCLVYILTCELFIASPSAWHRVRGTQMILVMKMISIAFDYDQGILAQLPNLLEYFGYSISASSIIFGPFMSYDDYSKILTGKRLSLSWIFGVTRSFLLCFICLLHSVCVSPYIFAEDDNKWLVAYQTAMSFRFSHYFVSYLSECTSIACGIGTETIFKDHKQTHWHFDVSRPQHVELPRSLVEVVIHWNVPNHVFLKNYVFKKTQRFGRFIAILLTFGCSSLLHGLNFQLAAVLLSIGVYAYIEHVLRSKMAALFNACIMARNCQPGCDHQWKKVFYSIGVVGML